MKSIIFRGHKERGKEIIEILKSFIDFSRDNGHVDTSLDGYYFLDDSGNICFTVCAPINSPIISIVTLEEFEWTYFKKGDFVVFHYNVYEVSNLVWFNNFIYYNLRDPNSGKTVYLNVPVYAVSSTKVYEI